MILGGQEIPFLQMPLPLFFFLMCYKRYFATIFEEYDGILNSTYIPSCQN